MEARQRRRVDTAQLLERVRHQICPHFNQGLEKDQCLKNLDGTSRRECRFKLHHKCSICACPGHGAHRCRDHIRDDSTPNPDNVIVHHVVPENPQHEATTPSIFVASPSHHTAQAAIRRDYRKQHGPGRMFHIVWDHAELLSARYKQYRQKQRNTKIKDKKDVWPDDIEESFQTGMLCKLKVLPSRLTSPSGLRCFARRGRKKVELHGKLCGGNEFISNWIWLDTGAWRDRKQVSSHIQVLKGYLLNNAKCKSLLVPALQCLNEAEYLLSGMGLVKANPEWNGKNKKHGNVALPVTPEYEHSTPSQYTHAVQHTYSNSQPPAPREVLPSNVPHGPTIRSVKFTIAQCDPEESADSSAAPSPPLTHHTYTSIQTEMGSAPRTLESLPHWRSTYPQLKPFDDKGNTVPIFLFESTLNPMENFIAEQKTEIRIVFAIDFAQGAYYQDWRSRTQVRDDNGLTGVQEHDIEVASDTDEHGVSVPRIGNDQTLTLHLPFRASYWADTFWMIIHRKSKARSSRISENVKNEEQWVRRFISSISVMQELWATPRTEGAQPRRMAVLLWKFQQTHGNEVPTTSWRRLIPPASPFRQQSPVPPQLQTPVSLHSALQPEFRTQAPVVNSYDADYYQHHPLGIFAENPEQMLLASQPLQSEGNSPESGLAHADDGSFPSSTSTSFPSSISGSTFRTVPSQQSSFDATDGGFPCLDSFTSQDTMYQVGHQEPGYHVYDDMPQEHLQYDGQEPLFHTQDQQQPFPQGASEYHSFDSQYGVQPMDDATLMANYHDFTGAKTQLSFAEQAIPPQTVPVTQDDKDKTYEEPLIAPRAHMISQHQILQLQHFEDLQQGLLQQSRHEQPERHEQGRQDHGEEPREAAQHLTAVSRDDIQQQSHDYQELEQQWTVPPSPWSEQVQQQQQQQQTYQHPAYAAASGPNQGQLDRWYVDAASKSRSYLQEFPPNNVIMNGSVVPYPVSAMRK